MITQSSKQFRFSRTLGVMGILLVCLGGVVAQPVLAQDTRYVAPSGNDSGNDCTSSNDPCATIQHAIDQASTGDTIQVASGTYNGFDIDKAVTVEGAGPDNTEIEGRITLEAENVTVQEFHVTNTGHAFMVPIDAEASGFTLINVRASDVNFGMEVRAHEGSEFNGGGFDNVLIDNFHIINADRKGLYIERLSDAEIVGVHVDGVIGDSPWNNGIDINLKDGDYENITIRDSVIEVVVEGDPDPSAMSAAIAIKARDDGSTYSANPATLDDVLIDNVTIRDSFNGLRVGEPGVDYSADPQGPTNVVIQSSDFSNNDGFQVEDLPGSLDIDTMLAENDFDQAVVVRGNSIVVPAIFSSI